MPERELLSVDEMVLLVRAAMSLGVEKVRLTGGEPLLRPGVVRIVRALADCGVPDLAMTTNGSLLVRHAGALREAGLGRLTVSLDTLDASVVPQVGDVLAGVRAAVAAGFAPLKLNCVVQRGVNDAGLLELVEFARAGGHVLRFIEYMDVGGTNGWRRSDVVSGAEVLALVRGRYALEPLPVEAGAVARRWRYADGGGELGIIASVTEPFCGDCTRLRVSADGLLYTCLFATQGVSVRAALRSGDVAVVAGALARRWAVRDDAYSEERGVVTAAGRVEMSYIGG